MKTILIAVLLTVNLFAIGGKISDYHYEHAGDNLSNYRKSRSNEEVDATNHGIAEIGIERDLCFGECPIYTFIIKRDGTFHYKGVAHAQRLGEFTGRIPVWHFHRLAQFIKDSSYMELEPDYARMVTCSPTTYTMVVMNGRRKTIRNHADAGPTKLWAVEQLIDDLFTKAEWDAAPPAPDKKP